MEISPLNAGGASYTEPTRNSGGDTAEPEAAFICNICLDITNKEPVVTQCGHLYCWPCLYRWLNTHHTTCPVCKAGISEDNVIPLFIKGSEYDPRSREASTTDGSGIPNRPGARRIEPTEATGLPPGAANLGVGVTFTASVGFFPSLFGLQFQSFSSFPPPVPTNRPLTAEEIQQLFLSRVLIALGAVVMLALLSF